MNQITTELHSKAVKSLQPLVKQLAISGMKPGDIAGRVKKHISAKVCDYLNQEEHDSNRMSFISVSLLKKIEGIRDDSKLNKSETVFHELLRERKIPFKPQVCIGKYRVDYLISDWLVFEGDGPHHLDQKEQDAIRDNYLTGLGYEIIRLPWEEVALIQEQLLDQIEDMIK